MLTDAEVGSKTRAILHSKASTQAQWQQVELLRAQCDPPKKAKPPADGPPAGGPPGGGQPAGESKAPVKKKTAVAKKTS